MIGIKGNLKVVGKQMLSVPRQGMNKGTLFIEINQYILESDKTKLHIEVFNADEKIEITTTSFLSPRSFN